MKIGQTCEDCDGFMQIVNPNPQYGDRLVCSHPECEFEDKITDFDYPIVRGADVLLVCGNTQKKCQCGENVDVILKCRTTKGTEEHGFCKSCLVGLVLENL